MEVLLLQDVAQIGKKNDLLVVGNGFALNFLLPRRLAIVATPVVRRRFAEVIRKRAEARETEKSAQMGMASALQGKQLQFLRKATKNGKLYAALSTEMLSEAFKEQLSLDVAASDIQVSEPIKALGTATVSILLAGQSVNIPVVVKEEKGEK